MCVHVCVRARVHMRPSCLGTQMSRDYYLLLHWLLTGLKSTDTLVKHKGSIRQVGGVLRGYVQLQGVGYWGATYNTGWNKTLNGWELRAHASEGFRVKGCMQWREWGWGLEGACNDGNGVEGYNNRGMTLTQTTKREQHSDKHKYGYHTGCILTNSNGGKTSEYTEQW